MKSIGRRIAILCIFTLPLFQKGVAQDLPQRIILNLTETPATSMAVTWRTTQVAGNAVTDVVEAPPGPTFGKSRTRLPATSAPLRLENGDTVFQHSALMAGLKPGTVYAYRVGHDSVWSEWNQFCTANDGAAPFSFVFLGDPQNDIRRQVSRVFRQAFRYAPGARFWLFTGDITSDPEDSLWEQWFDAAGFIPRMTPMLMSPGNHDHASVLVNGTKVRTRELPLWGPQFTLPLNGIPGLEETSYFVDYQGVRVVMLNSNYMLKEQAEWADSVLADNPNRWTIAAFHHPSYSTGGARDGRETRDAFQRVFERRGVDLVLQGHDHAYGRSKKLVGGKVVEDGDKGIVYVVSSSGPKFYALQPLYKDLMAKMGENVQLFQVITVDGNTLRYEAVTAAGRVFDSFELKK